MQSSSLVEFEQYIRKRGLRMTETKRDIFTILQEASAPISHKAITRKLPHIHFVTVYRSIDSLLKIDAVKQVPQGFKNLLELSDVFKPHHHHISCETCGAVRGIDDPRIEALIKDIARKTGYEPTRHHFELYGTCSHCTRNVAMEATRD